MLNPLDVLVSVAFDGQLAIVVCIRVVTMVTTWFEMLPFAAAHYAHTTGSECSAMICATAALEVARVSTEAGSHSARWQDRRTGRLALSSARVARWFRHYVLRRWGLRPVWLDWLRKLFRRVKDRGSG